MLKPRPKDLLPRDLRYERTVEALATGNHGLLKKPRGNTTEETSSTSADQLFLTHSAVYIIALEDCLDEHANVTARFYFAVQRVRAREPEGLRHSTIVVSTNTPHYHVVPHCSLGQGYR